ncbi:LysE family translocator [Marinomonas sp. A79]|uniref:LysE family translocator n=1 Tax=Marinomonas vulgaris TaxID=2823372 RepID=A0ABS5H8V9_9GAMM|nr:LysE family translocator [Marinomonas vulgaris]MBR7888035.1 LysE family translocator [Marinomonas vulgaris]
MTFSLWFSLFIICLLGAMSPGPSLAIVVKHSLAGGRANGLATSWAHAAGIGLYALVSLLGLAVVFHQFPLLFKAISLAGAAYLAYLGVNALLSKGGIATKLESGQAVSAFQAAKEGFLISILSPKIALFFTALFSPFVATIQDMSGKVMMVATPFLVDGLWYTLIAVLLSSPRLLNKLKHNAMLIDRLSGLVLILLAGYVVITVL